MFNNILIFVFRFNILKRKIKKINFVEYFLICFILGLRHLIHSNFIFITLSVIYTLMNSRRV